MKYGSFPSENKDLEKVVANDDGNQEDDANLIESVAEWAFVQARNSLKQKKGDRIDVGRESRRIQNGKEHFDSPYTPNSLQGNLESVFERGCHYSHVEKLNCSRDMKKDRMTKGNIVNSEYYVPEKLDTGVLKELQHASCTTKDTFTRDMGHNYCVEKTNVPDYRLD